MKTLGLAIDPGTTHSGIVEWNAVTRTVSYNDATMPNEEVVRFLNTFKDKYAWVAIEEIISRGHGNKHVICTAKWLGVFAGVAYPCKVILKASNFVRDHHCGNPVASEAKCNGITIEKYKDIVKPYSKKPSDDDLVELQSHAICAFSLATFVTETELHLKSYNKPYRFHEFG